MKEPRDIGENRRKQILVGGLILLGVGVLIVTVLMIWQKIPGVAGDSVGFVVGIMSTPFFMEGSFALIGLFIVVSLNSWRRRKNGDELVYLDDLKSGDERGE